MRLKKFVKVWCKYQLSLNWLNILFRYCIKLLLVINLITVLVGFAYKYKLIISQFKYVVAGLVLIDLFFKYKFPKNRQDLEAFHVTPNGVSFLTILNILQDIFSFRNLILPVFTMVLGLIIEPQYGLSFISMSVLSCTHNMVAGIVNERRKYIALVMALISVVTIYQMNIVLITVYLIFAIFLVIYQTYDEKQFCENETMNHNSFNSCYGIGNLFLWLDFIILKKSRHQQLALARVIATCILYFYLISVSYSRALDAGGFSSIILIQIYYSLAPAMLIPYILSSNYSYISLLMTMPNLKAFFTTKLNFILLFQLLLTLILCGVNYNDFQTIFLISSISIFNVFFITPIMFIGVLLTDEKVNIFDGNISNSFFIPSFLQSIYFLLVIICSGVILYTVQRISVNNFSWILLVIGVIGFFQKERFIKFFNSRYYRIKYKLFNTLH